MRKMYETPGITVVELHVPTLCLTALSNEAGSSSVDPDNPIDDPSMGEQQDWAELFCCLE